jgi:hypothetical protein
MKKKMNNLLYNDTSEVKKQGHEIDAMAQVWFRIYNY